MSKLKFSKYMTERIETINNHNKLYEGLICSYPIKHTIRYFNENISKLKQQRNSVFNEYKLRITYSFIKNENKALPYILINFEKKNINVDTKNNDRYIFDDEKTVFNKINKWFELCGWYCADITDTHGNRTKQSNNIRNLVFRAKYDVKVERKDWPEFLYHVTPIKNIEKIKRNGLVPKSGNKKIDHKEHIYLFDVKDPIELEFISNELKKEKDERYMSLKIDMKFVHELFRLYTDPDLKHSYFTLDNISPYNIIEYNELT